MTDFQAQWDAWCDFYDSVDESEDAAAVAAFLASLSPEGRFLQLEMGAGRVAVELATRGRSIDGIDSSSEMLDGLHDKVQKSGLDMTCEQGRMTDFDRPGRYSCIYIGSSSFYSLRSQNEQIDCLEACTQALSPGGRLVLECYLVQPELLWPPQQLSVRTLGFGRVGIMASEADYFSQRIDYVNVSLSGEGPMTFPVGHRYCWPAELDVMARIAGLRLVHRYGGYRGEEFCRSSVRHVSVYEEIS